MMKKLFLLLCLPGLWPLAAHAQGGGEKRLGVTLRSGHTHRLALSPGLEIELNRDNAVVVTNAADTLYMVGGVACLTFEGDFPVPDGVDGVEAEEPEIGLMADGIRIRGCAEGGMVSVFAADGKCLSRRTAKGGECFVPRRSLPKGVVIIQVNRKAFKLINR